MFSSYARKKITRLIKVNCISLKTFSQKNFSKNILSVVCKRISSKEKNNTETNQDWYVPSEPLVFENSRMNLVQANSSDVRLQKILRNLICLPISVLSVYKLVFSIINFRIISTILWGIIATFSIKIIKGLDINNHFIIKNIDLMQDGRQIEISTQHMKKIFDIKDIRRLNTEETKFIMTKMPDFAISYLPIIVNNQILLVPKSGKFTNTQLFKEICNGKYIKLVDIINKDDTIDI